MATNKIVHGNQESFFGFAQEATFGTAIADTAAFVRFECAIPTSIDYGVFMDNNYKNSGSRVLEDGEQYYTQSGGTRVISVSDIIVRQDDAAEIAYAVMQQCTEAATTDYQKTFSWVGVAGTETTQVDVSANAGYFATLGIYDPIASSSHKFTSCVARSAEFHWDLLGGDPRLKANVEYISGHAASSVANFSGAWTRNTQSYFDMSAPTFFSIGGTDVVVYAASIKLNNNAARVGYTTGGVCETFSFGPYETTISLTLKWDAATFGLIGDMNAGTGKAIILGVGADSTDGHFKIVTGPARITSAPKDYSAEVGQTIQIEATVGANSSTGAHTLITIADANDQSW